MGREKNAQQAMFQSSVDLTNKNESWCTHTGVKWSQMRANKRGRGKNPGSALGGAIRTEKKKDEHDFQFRLNEGEAATRVGPSPTHRRPIH